MIATKETQIGTALPELVTRAKNVQAREGRTFEKNIHDDAASQGFGFKRGFVAGGQSLGWISQVIVEFFGKTYYETGTFDATFVAPVFDDEDVTIRGTVRDRVEEGDKVRLHVDVWLEKSDGTKSVNATASALV